MSELGRRGLLKFCATKALVRFFQATPYTLAGFDTTTHSFSLLGGKRTLLYRP
jgi:hypothetical protein